MGVGLGSSDTVGVILVGETVDIGIYPKKTDAPVDFVLSVDTAVASKCVEAFLQPGTSFDDSLSPIDRCYELPVIGPVEQPPRDYRFNVNQKDSVVVSVLAAPGVLKRADIYWKDSNTQAPVDTLRSSVPLGASATRLPVVHGGIFGRRL